MSVSWQVNALQLCTQAYIKLGVLDPETGVSDFMWEQFLFSINAMLKGQQVDGANLYRLTQVQLVVPPLTGTPSNPFILTPTILQHLGSRFQVSPSPNLNERPMGEFTYADYMNLPNKESQSGSGPTIICFNKQEGQSIFYIWPLNPNVSLINSTVARTVNDVVSQTDNLDFPVEWTEGMVYAIADRMMDDHGMAAADAATADRIVKHAGRFYEKLMDFDRPTSVMIRPYGRRGRGKFWRG